MKKSEKQLLHIALMLIPLLLALLLLVILLKQVSLYDKIVQLYHALFPFFGGVVIAFLLQPVIDRLGLHMKNKTAVIVVYLGILVFIALLLVIFVPTLYQQTLDVITLMPEWIEKIKNFLYERHIVMERLSEYESTFMKNGTVMIIESLRSFLGTAMNYGIAYMTAFFISIDLDFWKHSVYRLVRRYPWFYNFYQTLNNIVFQYLSGTLIDLAFVSITSLVILYAANFPNALLYALILALSNLFPYIGPTIGLVFVIIVGMLSYDRFPIVTILLIWVMQQIEANIVQPMIFHKTMDVRPTLTFVALFVGEALFGIPGILLSPILASIMQIIFRSYLHAKTNDTIGKWEDIWYDFDEAMKDVDVPPNG